MSAPSIENALLANIHRKRVVHNLVYRHRDYDAVLAKWPGSSQYPQTFCIDDVAGLVFTIGSAPSVVAVYDWSSGEYLSCFRIPSVTLSESAVIRRIDGKRWLYLCTDRDTLGRVDITALPANLTEVSIADSYSFPMGDSFTYRNGVWTVRTTISEFGDRLNANRGRYIRRDEDFNEIGCLLIPTMRFLNNGGNYAARFRNTVPKMQGFAEGPDFFVAGMGGGYNPTAAPPETDYHLQGVRVFHSGGELMADSLVPATEMYALYRDLGLAATHIECEGVAYAYGNIYTLNPINSAAHPEARSGGLLIQQEFVPEGTSDAFDVSTVAKGYTVPTVEVISLGRQPIGDDLALRDHAAWQPLTSLADAFDLMRATGQFRLAFFADVANLTDFAGRTFPVNSFVEIIHVTNLRFDVRVHLESGGATVTRYIASTTRPETWTSVSSDTGWLEVETAAEFVPLSAAPPQARRKDGVLHLRGGWTRAAINRPDAEFAVGSLPPGLAVALTVDHVGVASSSTAATAGTVVVDRASGRVRIRTNHVVGEYYRIDGACLLGD